MPYCKNCGAEIQENTKYCTSCGHPVDKKDSALKDDEKNELEIADTAKESEEKKEDQSVGAPESENRENKEDAGESRNTDQPEQKKSGILQASKILLTIEAIWVGVSTIIKLISQIVTVLFGMLSLPVALIPAISSIIYALHLEEEIHVTENGISFDVAQILGDITQIIGIVGIIIAVIIIICATVCLIVWLAWTFIQIMAPLKLASKINSATSKSEVKGWAITCIVIGGLKLLNSVNIIDTVSSIINPFTMVTGIIDLATSLLFQFGLVGGILALVAKESEYKKPKK